MTRTDSDMADLSFTPHPFLRNGHLQTLAAYLFPGKLKPYRATCHVVDLADGDRLILHDDRPATWRSSDRAALLIHGLAGCHLSPYMCRVAGKLNESGVRTFRMDLRGCGAGMSLARKPYHSGISSDASIALTMIAKLCPDAPVTLIGFSLGGNISLKLVGERPRLPVGNLTNVIAVSPPVDLAACIRRLKQTPAWLYDRYFVRLLLRQYRLRRSVIQGMDDFARPLVPKRLEELDDLYTAPASGFGTAQNYYRLCSSCQYLDEVETPTVILASRDDPLLPAVSFESLKRSDRVKLCLTRHGGHLGFVGTNNGDPDRRWMDWRIVEWTIASLVPRE